MGPPFPSGGSAVGDYIFWNGTAWTVGSNNVNLGNNAGVDGIGNEFNYSVAIGYNAGQTSQMQYAIAIGQQAGRSAQGISAIAIGNQAAYSGQGTNSIAIGSQAGQTNQPDNCIAIGFQAGAFSQDRGAVAIGEKTGNYLQSNRAVAIGFEAGYSKQGPGCVAIGVQSGSFSQAGSCVAIGQSAGQDNQRLATVAIGNCAGQTNQFEYAVAIGFGAGALSQGGNTVAIGYQPARIYQSEQAIAIGLLAGELTQGTASIAIGSWAGNSSQASRAIAIGHSAGRTNQKKNSIAIGNFENFDDVTGNCLGEQSIVLNAFEVFPGFTIDQSNALYINPIRTRATIAAGWGSDVSGALVYNTVKKEVAVNTAKSFVIDHPTSNDRYLVHACLEGPESGVYYRGESEIVDNESVRIFLPDYVENLATQFSIQITPIYSGKKAVPPLQTSRIENNSFVVYGENSQFYWLVQGKRSEIIVEPLKSSTHVKGSGPYKWI
jgi:hypothetical protein